MYDHKRDNYKTRIDVTILRRASAQAEARGSERNYGRCFRSRNSVLFDRQYFTAILVVGLIGGCVAPGRSPLTAGSAKRLIRPGVTSQLEVIEAFGPPNIVTRQDGYETWVYDKVSSRQTYGAFGLGGGGGGIGSGGAGGGMLAGSFGSSTRSETTIMLIVYFDEFDKVRDYKISQTRF